mmetsp:Transcript_96509/g.242080  ORF Transcript_96509/g.242080 Transcript_96509/m.242080 type:complete len:534 (-) Transcript_96509:154-1755(-)
MPSQREIAAASGAGVIASDPRWLLSCKYDSKRKHGRAAAVVTELLGDRVNNPNRFSKSCCTIPQGCGADWTLDYNTGANEEKYRWCWNGPRCARNPALACTKAVEPNMEPQEWNCWKASYFWRLKKCRKMLRIVENGNLGEGQKIEAAMADELLLSEEEGSVKVINLDIDTAYDERGNVVLYAVRAYVLVPIVAGLIVILANRAKQPHRAWAPSLPELGFLIFLYAAWGFNEIYRTVRGRRPISLMIVNQFLRCLPGVSSEMSFNEVASAKQEMVKQNSRGFSPGTFLFGTFLVSVMMRYKLIQIIPTLSHRSIFMVFLQAVFMGGAVILASFLDARSAWLHSLSLRILRLAGDRLSGGLMRRIACGFAIYVLAGVGLIFVVLFCLFLLSMLVDFSCLCYGSAVHYARSLLLMVASVHCLSTSSPIPAVASFCLLMRLYVHGMIPAVTTICTYLYYATVWSIQFAAWAIWYLWTSGADAALASMQVELHDHGIAYRIRQQVNALKKLSAPVATNDLMEPLLQDHREVGTRREV